MRIAMEQISSLKNAKKKNKFLYKLYQFTLNEPYKLVSISITTSLGFESFKYKCKI